MRRVILAPSVVLALVVLAVNDHVLKGSGLAPDWLTGKASDVAGVYLLATLIAAGLARRVPVALSVGLVGLAFALMKTWPPANALANAVLGSTERDPTDLVALLVLPFAARTARRALGADGRPGPLETALAVAAALACAATSRPPEARNYPSWTFHDADKEGVVKRTVGCADVGTWVSKSGKEGMAVSVDARGCPISVSARFRMGELLVEQRSIEILDGGRGYFPFGFDNERAWNEERVHGALELTIRAGGVEEVVVFRMEHTWTGPHRFGYEGRDERPKPPMPVATGPLR